MKTTIAAITVLGVAALGFVTTADAQVRLGINVGVPAPVYVAPPVYAAPPPVVYAPQPVYAAPPPVYGPAIAIGWYGDRYYDGHRYWGRDEWYRHHPHDRDRRDWR
jgi:hypothetical protein